ncbi:MAG TPA: hypothetical protein VGI60_10500 [Chthoniobacterales bacterium]
MYLGCLLPSYCLLMNSNFQNVESLLQRLGLESEVKLLSLSTDPVHDGPEHLHQTAASYRAQTPHWTFAAVPDDQLKYLANATGLQFTKVNGQIVHNLRAAVLDHNFDCVDRSREIAGRRRNSLLSYERR